MNGRESGIRVSFARGGSCETFWRRKRQDAGDNIERSDALKPIRTQNQEEMPKGGKLWEANKMVDCHVVETASWMADENIRMVECDEEARYSDVSAECVLGEEIERDGTDSVVFKMREMKRVLKEWNRDSFGNVDVQYRDIVGEIEVLDTRINSDELGSNDLQRTRELHSRLWAVSRLQSM
ncbi:hypothetical protein V6N11_008664 [Hibiscus sabdariffa]|uniref:Uncharacterized protein n=1 Tax=Hibiscus sabdariffa TaxID=183260 RepID=A0ABR2PP22_9ROSI